MVLLYIRNAENIAFTHKNRGGNRMRRSILALFLALVMVVGVVSGGMLAFATETDAIPDEIQDVYVYDGVTYFNVNSPNVDVSTRLFIEDCLRATNATYLNAGSIPMKSKQSTANLWQYIALSIQK